MFDVGFWELFIIAVILLIVLGPERLPEIATKAGTYIRKIKNFTNNIDNDLLSGLDKENLEKSLKLEDEKSSILEIVEEGKQTISEIKETVENK